MWEKCKNIIAFRKISGLFCLSLLNIKGNTECAKNYLEWKNAPSVGRGHWYKIDKALRFSARQWG